MTKFDAASLSYFRATGHDLPHRIDDRNLAEFILSEMRRYSGMPGTSSRLSALLQEFERP